MVQLKNVIHFYLGCEAQVKRKNDKKFHIGTIVEVTKGSNHGNWVYVKFEDVITCTSNTWERSASNMHYFFIAEDDIKPVLRPLSDMTDEECLEVCKLASPTAYGDYRFKKWIVRLDDKSDIHWKAYDVTNENADYSFVVELIDGDITLYDAGDNDFTLIDQNYRFWYLEKGFDIFGLIKSGQAIDKTTL